MRAIRWVSLEVLAAVLLSVPTLKAQEIGGVVTLTQPASTLIMPFDNTANHVSFQMVTNVDPDAVQTFSTVATRWSYWADDGRHLVDVLACLRGDTKVMDPEAVQGELQLPNPSHNVGVGMPTNLAGERGLVFVTAVEPDLGGPIECLVPDPTKLEAEVIGSWVIADTSTNFAFGADAIGVGPNTLPDPDVLAGGLLVPTFNPESLQESSVIILTAEVGVGAEPLAEFKFGPIQRDRPDLGHVCCAVTFLGPDETTVPLPDLCFDSVGFHPISARQATSSEVPIIPSTETIAAPGVVRLDGCTAADEQGEIVPVGAAFEQFLFAVHGQAIGPFGMASHGKYVGSAPE